MSYATDEAREVFRLFYNKLVDLQMGLGRFYTLIAKSWEKAIRLALDFAICDESNMIDEQTAINACEEVGYCNGVLLGYYENDYFDKLEDIKRKVEEVFSRQKQNRLTAGIFQRQQRISMEDLEKAVKAYPQLFKIENGTTNGKVVLYLGNPK